MVSFQAYSLSPTSTKTIPDLDNSWKKRKWEETALPGDNETFDKKNKAETTKSIFDIELHLETPLPLEWERRLDIQSGQIHFYNTRTNKRTSGDPRRSPEPPTEGHGHMSLDLELNLPCDSQRKNQACTNHNFMTTPRHLTDLSIDINQQKKTTSPGNIARSPSWLAFEGDQQQEMVATACMKCHMLVMLCKSSPTCPNCKFMHPPDQSSPKLFKQRLSLLC